MSQARSQIRRAAKRAPVPAVKVPIPAVDTCRVYWGSHGCDRPRNHEGDCVCLDCLYDELGNPEWAAYRGMPPYYGPETRFYGEDVEARGLPAVKA
jgi:hypothetical protein